MLLAVGLLLGPLVNWAIYRLAYYHRPRTPWGPQADPGYPRRVRDRIPIIGWLGMRRESPLHGRGFWVRPLLIEMAVPILLVWLYWFEVQGGLLPPWPVVRGPGAGGASALWTHALFLSHTLLFLLLIVATFIDFDEQTIPDVITLPGTLLALLLASTSLNFLMPSRPFPPGAGAPLPIAADIQPLLFGGPGVFDARWFGGDGLALAIAIITIWSFALLDRRWITRQGFRKAVQYFVAGMFRYRTWMIVLCLWLLLSAAAIACWSIGGRHWQGFLTSLVGLGVGGLTVWSVRLVAQVALGKEAMGFGDVTFLAMIGAFLGWQAALITFFLAPIAALFFALAQLVLRGQRALPFGPYLSVGAAGLVIFWDPIWNQNARPLFVIGPVIPLVLVFSLSAMGLLLWLWRMVEQALTRR